MVKTGHPAASGQSKRAMHGLLAQIRGRAIYRRNCAILTQSSQKNFGVTISGEMAASPNDCGLFLRGAGSNSANSQCPYYDDWKRYNDTMKEGIQNFALASFDALQNWFFWTWKVRAYYSSPRTI